MELLQSLEWQTLLPHDSDETVVSSDSSNIAVDAIAEQHMDGHVIGGPDWIIDDFEEGHYFVAPDNHENLIQVEDWFAIELVNGDGVGVINVIAVVEAESLHNVIYVHDCKVFYATVFAYMTS